MNHRPSLLWLALEPRARSRERRDALLSASGAPDNDADARHWRVDRGVYSGSAGRLASAIHDVPRERRSRGSNAGLDHNFGTSGTEQAVLTHGSGRGLILDSYIFG